MKKTRGKMRKKPSSAKHPVHISKAKIHAYAKKEFAKRQLFDLKTLLIITISLFLFVTLFLLVSNYISSTGGAITGYTNAVTGGATEGTKENPCKIVEGDWWSTLAMKGEGGIIQKLLTYGKYIWGRETIECEGMTQINGLIVLIVVWLILALAMSDILRNFSLFSKGICWFIGFGLAILIANLGWLSKLLVGVTLFFGAFGAAAVYMGIGVAFLLFIITNVISAKLGFFILKNKAEKEAAGLDTAGVQIGGLFKGLGEMIKGLKESKINK